MAELPKEITLEILSRLASKSLARFRCVSRSWNSLQYDHGFAKLRFKNAPQQPQIGAQKLLISSASTFACLDCETLPCSLEVDRIGLDYPFSLSCNHIEEVDKVGLDFPFKKPNLAVEIVGSCNGLVCVISVNDFFVWNPSTGMYRKVPDPGIDDHYCVCYGFGYDSVSDDYKIILLTILKVEYAESGLSAQVFSLKSNSWKMLPKPNLSDRPLNWITGVMGLLHNGTLHWIVCNFICAFDVVTENFYEVPLPAEDAEDPDSISFQDLGVLKGCLCVARSERVDDSYALQLLMKKDNLMAGTWSWVEVDESEAPTYLCVTGDGTNYNKLQILCVTQRGARIVKAHRHSLAMFISPEDEHYYHNVCGGEAFETYPIHRESQLTLFTLSFPML